MLRFSNISFLYIKFNIVQRSKKSIDVANPKKETQKANQNVQTIQIMDPDDLVAEKYRVANVNHAADLKKNRRKFIGLFHVAYHE